MSGGGFAHDIAGGNGNLIIAAVQSPNFVTGSAGWQIRKDGSLEAQNATIRGTVTASTVNGGTITGATISGGTVQGADLSTSNANGSIDISGNQVTFGSGSFISDSATHQLVIGGNVGVNAIEVLLPFSTKLLAVQPGTTYTAEGWHTGAGLNSFVLAPSGYMKFQYRLQADGTVEIAGCVQIPATFADVPFFTLPAGYRPNATVQWPYSTQQGLTLTGTSTGTGAVQVDTSGTMTLRNNPAGLASGNVIYVQGRFGLGTV